jgi:quercetin dioxygenase-like cupin family protein
MPERLSQNPVHLGLDATAVAQPTFTGMEWYAAYGQRNAGDGKEGRLVSMHTFSEPWGTWEMHPEGHEVVVCTAGEITLIQDADGETTRVTLGVGEYAINPPGVWHTAEVSAPATALFITAGLGTQIRPR